MQPATLGIVAILGGRFLSWERESEKGKGADEARLALEEVLNERGRTLVMAMDRASQESPAPANRHSTALSWWCLRRWCIYISALREK